MITFQAVRSEEHIQEVARLAREIWREHYVPIIGRNQVDYMLEKFQSSRAIGRQLGDAAEYYIVVNRGQSAGYVAVIPDRNESALMISKIYIKKSERGRGLGKQTLQFVETLCRRRGIRRMWLTVNKHNTHSIAWYERMGFKNSGSIVADIGNGFVMDDFKMEKAVGP